jgi:hypothetical protein
MSWVGEIAGAATSCGGYAVSTILRRHDFFLREVAGGALAHFGGISPRHASSSGQTVERFKNPPWFRARVRLRVLKSDP